MWRLALIEYLVTPLDSNTPSPSELNGRRLNSLLPNITHNKHSDQLVDKHHAQLQQDKRGHVLPDLPVGSKIGYRNHVTNKFDVGIVSAGDAMSYTEIGAHISQNCIDLNVLTHPLNLKPNK